MKQTDSKFSNNILVWQPWLAWAVVRGGLCDVTSKLQGITRLISTKGFRHTSSARVLAVAR
jgi:hypothetical protein